MFRFRYVAYQAKKFQKFRVPPIKPGVLLPFEKLLRTIPTNSQRGGKKPDYTCPI